MKTPDETKRQLITCLEINTDKFDPEAKYQAMRDALAYIRQLEAERDAAVNDLKNASACFACKKFIRNGGMCRGGGQCEMDAFEWRGVKEEDTHEQ